MIQFLQKLLSDRLSHRDQTDPTPRIPSNDRDRPCQFGGQRCERNRPRSHRWGRAPLQRPGSARWRGAQVLGLGFQFLGYAGELAVVAAFEFVG
jgi:hypothetical protein